MYGSQHPYPGGHLFTAGELKVMRVSLGWVEV